MNLQPSNRWCLSSILVVSSFVSMSFGCSQKDGNEQAPVFEAGAAKSATSAANGASPNQPAIGRVESDSGQKDPLAAPLAATQDATGTANAASAVTADATTLSKPPATDGNASGDSSGLVEGAAGTADAGKLVATASGGTTPLGDATVTGSTVAASTGTTEAVYESSSGVKPVTAGLESGPNATTQASVVEAVKAADSTTPLKVTSTTSTTSTTSASETATPAIVAGEVTAQEHVVLATQAGVLVIDLFEEDAPKHVANFKKLVADGFYNGLTFYRVVEDFIAQAGDPKGTGSGGPGYTIPAEIKRKHVRGSVVMARDTADPSKASNGSQFYICLKPHASFDKQEYTVFGQVIQGMDVTGRLEKYTLQNVKDTRGILPNDRRTKILETKMFKTEVGAATATPYDEHAVLKTTAGEIVIDLFEAEAPRHAANFQKLVREGFYENLTFHRVIRNFIAQAGDPKGDGSGGPGYTLPSEFGRKHVRGAVAAARLPDQINPERRSGGSQFFVCYKDASHLDAGGYTVFGQVVRGMDSVDQLPNGPTSENGAVPVAERAVIESAAMVPASAGE
jgi:cyclophilin family peptidyl-prolyl cis-trans isomerase